MTHKDVARINALYNDMMPRFLELSNEMFEIVQKSKVPGTYTLGELCDIGFFFREIRDMGKELRLEGETKRGFIARLMALQVTQDLIQTKRTTDKVKGEFANGTAKCDFKPIFPKHGTEAYDKVMDFFQLPEAAKQSGIFSLHWKRLSEYLSQAAQEGREGVPKEILETAPVYDVIFRRKTKKQSEN